ncbi:hypothetical protein HDZ31DRAFT_71286 [Schizophyllum fasciatum]
MEGAAGSSMPGSAGPLQALSFGACGGARRLPERSVGRSAPSHLPRRALGQTDELRLIGATIKGIEDSKHAVHSESSAFAHFLTEVASRQQLKSPPEKGDVIQRVTHNLKVAIPRLGDKLYSAVASALPVATKSRNTRITGAAPRINEPCYRWLLSHLDNPYPTRKEWESLGQESGTSLLDAKRRAERRVPSPSLSSSGRSKRRVSDAGLDTVETSTKRSKCADSASGAQCASSGEQTVPSAGISTATRFPGTLSGFPPLGKKAYQSSPAVKFGQPSLSAKRPSSPDLESPSSKRQRVVPVWRDPRKAESPSGTAIRYHMSRRQHRATSLDSSVPSGSSTSMTSNRRAVSFTAVWPSQPCCAMASTRDSSVYGGDQRGTFEVAPHPVESHLGSNAMGTSNNIVNDDLGDPALSAEITRYTIPDATPLCPAENSALVWTYDSVSSLEAVTFASSDNLLPMSGRRLSDQLPEQCAIADEDQNNPYTIGDDLSLFAAAPANSGWDGIPTDFSDLASWSYNTAGAEWCPWNATGGVHDILGSLPHSSLCGPAYVAPLA